MKTANEVVKEFLEGIEENYDQNLKTRMDEIKKTGLTKQKEIQT